MTTEPHMEVTWKIATKLWWAFLWRSILWALVTAMIVSIIFNISATLAIKFGLLEVTLQLRMGLIIFSAFLGGCCGIWASIFSIKTILQKDYSEFYIALIPTENRSYTTRNEINLAK